MDLLKWNKKRRFVHRWMAEAAFSSIKRLFGEYACATRFQNMAKEMVTKVLLHNLFTGLARIRVFCWFLGYALNTFKHVNRSIVCSAQPLERLYKRVSTPQNN